MKFPRRKTFLNLANGKRTQYLSTIEHCALLDLAVTETAALVERKNREISALEQKLITAVKEAYAAAPASTAYAAAYAYAYSEDKQIFLLRDLIVKGIETGDTVLETK